MRRHRIHRNIQLVDPLQVRKPSYIYFQAFTMKDEKFYNRILVTRQGTDRRHK